MQTTAMVPTATTAYVLLDSREEFDRLNVPAIATDVGGDRRVHVKQVTDQGTGVTVYFQHWTSIR